MATAQLTPSSDSAPRANAHPSRQGGGWLCLTQGDSLPAGPTLPSPRLPGLCGNPKVHSLLEGPGTVAPPPCPGHLPCSRAPRGRGTRAPSPAWRYWAGWRTSTAERGRARSSETCNAEHGPQPPAEPGAARQCTLWHPARGCTRQNRHTPARLPEERASEEAGREKPPTTASTRTGGKGCRAGAHVHQGPHQPHGCLRRVECNSGLYKCNSSLTRGKELGIAAR